MSCRMPKVGRAIGGAPIFHMASELSLFPLGDHVIVDKCCDGCLFLFINDALRIKRFEDDLLYTVIHNIITLFWPLGPSSLLESQHSVFGARWLFNSWTWFYFESAEGGLMIRKGEAWATGLICQTYSETRDRKKAALRKRAASCWISWGLLLFSSSWPISFICNDKDTSLSPGTEEPLFWGWSKGFIPPSFASQFHPVLCDDLKKKGQGLWKGKMIDHTGSDSSTWLAFCMGWEDTDEELEDADVPKERVARVHGIIGQRFLQSPEGLCVIHFIQALAQDSHLTHEERERNAH